MLQIYNSLTRTKETFSPIVPGKIGMYVCGITVYDFCHLGHARMFVVFDTVYRHLLASGYEVNYVRNITDIDDKIIGRAAELGEPYLDLSNRFIDAMKEDEAALAILPPRLEPRCTDHVPQMIKLIETLVAKDVAYQGSNGDVYYSVSKFEGYGKLSGRKLEDLRAGERVAVDADKQDPLDFVLWKSVKPNEPHWESPWGPGRPGWHIECSAMAAESIGEQFDIHGGGMDLQFPHHENEIAQSEAAHDKTLANYWMHNGFVRVDDEKMSKSLGNFATIRDVLEKYEGEVLRLFLLSSHYRSPLNFSTESLDSATAGLRRLYTALRAWPKTDGHADSHTGEHVERFNAAMDDDFNTSDAIAVLFDLAGELNRVTPGSDAGVKLAQTLRHLGDRLGVLSHDAETWLQAGSDDGSGLSTDAIEAAIAERLEARANKDFARSDEIRDELKAAGVVLEDSAGKTTWRRE